MGLMEYSRALFIGLILSGLVGVLAQKRGSLSRNGVVGAILTGTIIFGLGGWVWGLTLITFFVSSSALSHYRESSKADLAEKFAKGQRRDLGQALANGGVGAMLALVNVVWGEPVLFAAFIGAMATVNADTWATELGVFNPSPPRLITSGQTVEIGTSGAVSRLGIAASLAGGLAIGLAALTFSLIDAWLSGTAIGDLGWMIPIALTSGLIGSLSDSLMGASIQSIYYCPRCEKETEKPLHGCGARTEYRRGWRWLDNDLVNLISSLVGALVAVLSFLLL
jgi:uncharacterized protein (TIGR00297 family)